MFLWSKLKEIKIGSQTLGISFVFLGAKAPLGLVRTCNNIVRYCEIVLDIARYCQILSDIVRYCQILLDIVRYCQILPKTHTKWFEILKLLDIARHCKIL